MANKHRAGERGRMPRQGWRAIVQVVFPSYLITIFIEIRLSFAVVVYDVKLPNFFIRLSTMKFFLLTCILKHLEYLVLETKFEQYTLKIYSTLKCFYIFEI